MSLRPVQRCLPRRAVAAAAAKGPVVVIDNYDSFTYNLCQVIATVPGVRCPAGPEKPWRPHAGTC